MNHHEPLIELPREHTLRIADGRPHLIAVFDGRVWLTHDGDLRDVILEAGDSFAVDGHGVTLVQAFRDARLVVSAGVAHEHGRRVDAVALHRHLRAQRDAAMAALIARGAVRVERALLRAAQSAAAWLSALRRPLRAA